MKMYLYVYIKEGRINVLSIACLKYEKFTTIYTKCVNNDSYLLDVGSLESLILRITCKYLCIRNIFTKNYVSKQFNLICYSNSFKFNLRQ